MKRQELPPEITEAATGLRGLLRVEESLRFPKEFVKTYDGYLLSLAEYSGDAPNWREPEWGPDLRKSGFREASKVIVKAVAGGFAYAVTPDFPARKLNVLEIAGLAALHPDGPGPTRRKISEGEREVIGRQVLLYEAVCAVNYGCSMRTLQADTGLGKEQGLLRLVQLDKSTVTLPFVQNWIKRAQHQGDWKFLERLGKAIARPPFEAPTGMYAALVLIAAFWDEFFRSQRYPDTIQVLEGLRVLPRNQVEPRTLSEALRRRGFKKQEHRQS